MTLPNRIWDEMFARLLSFHEEFGHYLVPADWDDRKLAVWVRTQRGNAGAGRLRDDRRRRLRDVAFTFSVQREEWTARLDELAGWKERHGHCAVPRFDPEVPGLGIWVSQQRNRRERLSREQLAQLDALGFSWDRQEERWKAMLSALEAYEKVHGHGDVPRHSREHRRLSQWVAQQRDRYRLGRLTPQRIRDLTSRGVHLGGPSHRSMAFDTRLAQLTDFKARFGHLDPPDAWPKSLRAWTNRQRAALARSTLHPGEARRLRALGLDTVPRVQHFERLHFEAMLKKLSAFRGREGHCRVSSKQNSPLASFVHKLRKAGAAALRAEDRARLDALGFTWRAWEEDWERGFALLVAFRARHGHVDGPFRLGHPTLSRWVTKQRRYKRLGKLPREQVRRLEAVGFSWLGQKGRGRRGGDALLEHLKAFKRTQRHFLVPAAFPWQALYAFCEQQRAMARDGVLPREARSALERLGFPLTAYELAWERMLSLVIKRLDRGGKLRPSDGARALYRWLSRQRALSASGELELDRERRLAELGLLT